MRVRPSGNLSAMTVSATCRGVSLCRTGRNSVAGRRSTFKILGMGRGRRSPGIGLRSGFHPEPAGAETIAVITSPSGFAPHSYLPLIQESGVLRSRSLGRALAHEPCTMIIFTTNYNIGQKENGKHESCAREGEHKGATVIRLPKGTKLEKNMISETGHPSSRLSTETNTENRASPNMHYSFTSVDACFTRHPASDLCDDECPRPPRFLFSVLLSSFLHKGQKVALINQRSTHFAWNTWWQSSTRQMSGACALKDS